MNTIEVMRQALDALERVPIDYNFQGNSTDSTLESVNNAITALKQAIEQYEAAEPVAWCLEVYDFAEMVTDKEIYTEQIKGKAIPLYTHPAPAVPEISSDTDCKEADGCPTELAVLQRFWRETKSAAPVECEHQFVTTFGGDYCIKCNVLAPSNDHPAAPE